MEADPWADAPISEPSRSARNSLEAAPHEATGSSSTATGTGAFGSLSPLSAPAVTVIDPPPASNAEEDEFGDEFDDFDATPIAGPSGTGETGGAMGGQDDDAFGDFGDFEEGDFDAAESQPAAADVSIPPEAEEKLPSLSLRPFPSPSTLVAQLSSLLSPLLDPSSSAFTDEPPRLASSSRQILPTETARDAYIQLASPPQLKPLDWTRSRVRREHLIHMGIPVNLDEVDSHLLSKLPALTISTNFGDLRRKERRSEEVASNGRRSGSRGPKGKEREVESMPVSAMPREANGEGKYGLGPRPELDIQDAERLCGIEEDQISILAPAALAKIQADLVQSSAQASALLAHLLQLKDAQTHDAATYNGMISNLITNAANARSAQQAGSGGVFRRTSVRRPVSAVPAGAGVGSGTVTPRTGSPAMR